MHSSTLFIYGLLLQLSAATYVLEDDYTPDAFFSLFSFFTGADPTHGYVTYVDQGTAQNTGLISIAGGQVHIGVDSNNIATGTGRNSVRISSNKAYNHGLFVLDLAHMPGGVCWLLGPNWPSSGEIDIIEGVHTQSNNAMTLHTSSNCTIDNFPPSSSSRPASIPPAPAPPTSAFFTGTLATSDCYVYAPNQPANAGCDIQSQDTRSYGAGFNAAGGGVYAVEWTSQGVSIWFWSRAEIPVDLVSGGAGGGVSVEGWGVPVARFAGVGCDFEEHFRDLGIIIDTTFCGDWAGATWSSTPTCAALAPSCEAYVQNNPAAFADMYWLINSLRVYRDDGVVAAAAAVPVVRLGVAVEGVVVGGVDGAGDVEGEGKNETLPLLSVPLAMGGGLPGRKSRMG